MQPMKESIVTILHGIKTWGDASISRLREELQRQIRAARQTAVAAKQSADNADKRIGQLWDGMGGAYERLGDLDDGLAALKARPEVPTPSEADTGKMLQVADGKYILADTPTNEELKLIYHGTLQEAVDGFFLTNGALSVNGSISVDLSCTELHIQAYIPGDPNLKPTKIANVTASAGITMPGAFVIAPTVGLGRILTSGYTFARAHINLLTGECKSSVVQDSEGGNITPYSTSTNHYFGKVELDAFKSMSAFDNSALTCDASKARITNLNIYPAYIGETLPAGTEILIRGR